MKNVNEQNEGSLIVKHNKLNEKTFRNEQQAIQKQKARYSANIFSYFANSTWVQWVEIVSEEVISYSGTCVFTINSCNIHDCHVTTIKVEEISHQNQLYKDKKISFEKDFNQLY